MTEEQKLANILLARRSSKNPVETGNMQEFIVQFSPAGTVRCRIVDGQSGQPRPFLFGRGETEAFPDPLQASRIIATPEGNPIGVFAAGFPSDAAANVSVFFFNDGAISGDNFIYQKEDGTQLQLTLFAVINGNPTQIFSTQINDNQEHSTTIQIPK